MPRFSLEDLDNYVDKAETAAALTSLIAGGYTLAVPNQYTAAIAAGSNIAGSAIDLYQTGRSIQKGDYSAVAKNVGEMILGVIGAKAIKRGQKLLELDRALDASNASRRYVTKTIGRTKRTRHKFTITKERDNGNKSIALGLGSNIGANMSSLAETSVNKPNYVTPSDNTRIARQYRPSFSTVKGR